MATATVRRVPMPRGEIPDATRKNLSRLDEKRQAAEMAYRAAVVQALSDGASFVELAKATGLSTNTLQRWKREAS